MSNHTPGPWFGYTTGWKTNPFAVGAKGRSGVVANMTQRATIPKDEAWANCQLIAAAPDLLDTLKTAYRIASEHDQSQPFDWAVYCEMLHASIAKAEKGKAC